MSELEEEPSLLGLLWSAFLALMLCWLFNRHQLLPYKFKLDDAHDFGLKCSRCPYWRKMKDKD